MVVQDTAFDIGRVIYDSLVDAGWEHPVGSEPWTYAQTLRTAYRAVGPDVLYPTLAQADQSGQRVELTSSAPVDSYDQPDGIRLI